jgi:hypothetical protein
MSTIERAIEIAAAAHAGQRGKDGDPYILHPLRVMLAVKAEHERMAAALHDVVEDTSVTLADLSEAGFPEEVVRAVDALTKRDGETREQAAHRAVADPVARVVKLADVTDNMDLSRIPRPKKKDRDRLAEYEKVKAILEAGPTPEADAPAGETAAESAGDQTMDLRHPRIRINYTYAFKDAATMLAYKYNDLGAVATLFHDQSEGRMAFRGRLCYFNSDPLVVAMAERLAKDVSKIAKVEARFVAFPQRDTDFIVYLISKPGKRQKAKQPKAKDARSDVVEELVQCPQCPARIRKERLAKHIKKAHPAQDIAPADPPNGIAQEGLAHEIHEKD